MKENIDELLVSSSVLEDMFGVKDSMIRRLTEQGIVERDSHGKYRMVKSVKNYILTLKVAKASKNQPVPFDGVQSLDAERAMHEHVKRQITEIKLQLIKGSVHKSEDVEAVMTDMHAKFKTKMESLPTKLAKMLEGEGRIEIQRILKEEISDALRELSEYNPKDFYSDEHIEISEDALHEVLESVNDG